MGLGRVGQEGGGGERGQVGITRGSDSQGRAQVVQVLQILDMTNCEIGVIARGGGGNAASAFTHTRQLVNLCSFLGGARRRGRGRGEGGQSLEWGTTMQSRSDNKWYNHDACSCLVAV